MKKAILLVCVLVITKSVVGQKIEKFFDFKWKETTVDNAMYYGVWEKIDSIWHRKDYYIHHKTLQMEGSYKDEACKILHGEFKHYYANGNIEEISNYVNNIKEGISLEFHPNGMIKDSTIYRNGKMVGTSAGWYESGNVKYERILDTFGNQSGVCINYFDNERLSFKGSWLNNFKKNGIWTYYHSNGNKAQNVTYLNDSIVETSCYDINGIQQERCELKDSSAQFNGGTKALIKYIEKKTYWPNDYKFTRDGKATVTLKFTIDENGKVKNPFVLVGFHPAFDKIAMEIFKGMPDWTPAIHKNRKVEQSFTQSISFNSSE